MALPVERRINRVDNHQLLVGGPPCGVRWDPASGLCCGLSAPRGATVGSSGSSRLSQAGHRSSDGEGGASRGQARTPRGGPGGVTVK